jgi:DHA1 family tetracycline resistance protein-like MFS transporter
MSLSIFTLTCYGLATQGWMIYATICIGAFTGITGPSLQSYITKHVPANEQGGVQGVFTGLQSLAGIPGPIIGTHAFGWAIAASRTQQVPGITFFMGAACTALALFLVARSFRKFAHTPGTAG